MSIISTGTIHTYEASLDTIKQLIAQDLNKSVKNITVDYVIGNIGESDPMDRYPAPQGVVKVRITVKE